MGANVSLPFYRSRLRVFLVYIGFIGVLSGVYRNEVMPADPAGAERDERLWRVWRLRREQVPNLFESLYGKSVNFRDERLMFMLTFVSPVQPDARVVIHGQSIDKRLLQWSYSSFTHWFKDEWLPTKEQAKPVAFYLRQSEDDVNLSTLYYAWNKDGIEVRAVESSTGLLLQIHDPTLDFKSGLSRERAIQLFKSIFWIPVDLPIARNRPDEREPFDLARVWRLPENLTPGAIFGSYKAPENAQFFGYWQYATIGFVTEQDLVIVVLRPNDGGHLGQPNKGIICFMAHLGCFSDPAWLDDAISDANGKKIHMPVKTSTTGRDEP